MKLLGFTQIIKAHVFGISTLSSSSNIYNCFGTVDIQNKFRSEINTHHLTHNEPMQESVWNEINRKFVKECQLSTYGNQTTGNYQTINKTTKINRFRADMSSYLMTVEHTGIDETTIDDIINRTKTMIRPTSYYSILLMEDNYSGIEYHWCVIPNNYHMFDTSRYIWEPCYANHGPKKGTQSGWKSKFVNISFNRSPKVLFHFELTDVRKYILASVKIKRID